MNKRIAALTAAVVVAGVLACMGIVLFSNPALTEWIVAQQQGQDGILLRFDDRQQSGNGTDGEIRKTEDIPQPVGGGGDIDYESLLGEECDGTPMHPKGYMWPKNDYEAAWFKAHPEYYVDENGDEVQKGYLMVFFFSKVGESRMREIVEELGCEWYGGILGDVASETDTTDVDIRVPDGQELAMRDAFEAYDEVDFAIRHEKPSSDVARFAGSEDGSARGLVVADDNQRYHLFASRFYKAWEVVKCDSSITVAVLDSGKPKKYSSDLEENVDFQAAYDAASGYTNYGVDANGHGTQVAGLISATVGNGIGTDGASYAARILPVRVTGEDGKTPALEYIHRGLKYLSKLEEVPNVINMSIEASVGDAAAMRKLLSEVQEDVRTLRNRGVVVVVASGNAINLSGEVDATCNIANDLALLDGVLSVGSVAAPADAQLDEIVKESRFREAEIADFSVTVSDTDLVACGADVTVLCPNPSDLPGFTLQKRSGTSLAAPQVSAAAALVKKAHPGWSASQIETALKETATPVSGEGSGHGLLDAYAAVLRYVPPATSEGSSGGSLSPHTGGNLYDLALSKAS